MVLSIFRYIWCRSFELALEKERTPNEPIQHYTAVGFQTMNVRKSVRCQKLTNHRMQYLQGTAGYWM